jgi:hypothetical protein
MKASTKRPIGCLLLVFGLAMLLANAARSIPTIDGTAAYWGYWTARLILVALVVLGFRLTRAQDNGSKPN